MAVLHLCPPLCCGIYADVRNSDDSYDDTKVRLGKNATVSFKVLDDATTAITPPVVFSAVQSSGAAIPLAITQPTKLLTHTPSTATWQAVLEGDGIKLTVNGLMVRKVNLS